MIEVAVMSNFIFLQEEWPNLMESAQNAEKHVNKDPVTCCFYSRYTLENMVKWIYANDSYLEHPGKRMLGSLVNAPKFKELLQLGIFDKIQIIQKKGNAAVHGEDVSPGDSLQVLKELHHVLYWFYRTYRSVPEIEDVLFDLDLIPEEPSTPTKQISELEKQLAEKEEQLKAQELKIKKTQQELINHYLKIRENKVRNQKAPDPHNYNEKETREYLIDILLQEAGWDVHAENALFLFQARPRKFWLVGEHLLH